MHYEFSNCLLNDQNWIEMLTSIHIIDNINSHNIESVLKYKTKLPKFFANPYFSSKFKCHVEKEIFFKKYEQYIRWGGYWSEESRRFFWWVQDTLGEFPSQFLLNQVTVADIWLISGVLDHVTAFWGWIATNYKQKIHNFLNTFQSSTNKTHHIFNIWLYKCCEEVLCIHS